MHHTSLNSDAVSMLDRTDPMGRPKIRTQYRLGYFLDPKF